MANQFLPKLSRDEREAKNLADGINNGSIILPPVGVTDGSHLPADRDIPMGDMLRAARLDALAREFALAAQDSMGADRATLLASRRYRDLRFHPRYKREAAQASRA